MNIYFDTEFTGLVPNTTLISLGCIAETGEKFYAEFTDYNKDLCDDWIKENVLKNLYLKKDPNSVSALVKYDSGTRDMYVKGDSRQVLKHFKDWLIYLNNKYGQRIQFVSDVCHYDFYLLCNLFGGSFSLPEYVNPVCYDICQDIAVSDEFNTLNRPDFFLVNAGTMYHAFDISREDLCKDITGKLPEGKKHNSLYDAEVIKMIYEGMRK